MNVLPPFSLHESPLLSPCFFECIFTLFVVAVIPLVSPLFALASPLAPPPLVSSPSKQITLVLPLVAFFSGALKALVVISFGLFFVNGGKNEEAVTLFWYLVFGKEHTDMGVMASPGGTSARSSIVESAQRRAQPAFGMHVEPAVGP